MTTDKTPATLAADVLAVMHSALGDLMAAQIGGIDTDTKVPDLSASIDAVSQLIEACSSLSHDPHAEDWVVFDAALARVKGESA